MSTKRLLPWAGSALLIWSLGLAPEARGQVSLHVNLTRHPGASVHFGTEHRPEVRPVAPVVVPRGRPVPHYEPPAMVRHEHYEHHADWSRWRNPYRDEYWRRFRPGWFPVVLGDVQYYAYPALPVGYQAVVVNGVTYYFADGIYYQPYIYEGQTVFVAVPPPVPG